jgi:RHS repeat-associated protein
VENRIASVSAAGVQYAYDSRNKRIWKSTLTNGNLAQEVYFYGADGQKIGTYAFQLALINGVAPEMTDNGNIKLAVFFGSKRLGTFDRLGTAKYDQQNGVAISLYPYGEDRGTIQPNDSLKFATYTRDTATGLDYADQRYYASNFGRFMSPDPYRASGGPKSPGSWNRYTYVEGDPVNFYDPHGRDWCLPTESIGSARGRYDALLGDPGEDCCDPEDPWCDGGGGGGGGGRIRSAVPSLTLRSKSPIG